MPTQIVSFWQELEPRQRLVGALGIVAILVALTGFGRIASSPSMALLYSGLDPAAAGEVVAALEAEGIPFEVRDSAILIEASQRDRVRMQLAGQGLPAGGPSGYEILDGLSGFGTTSQMFDAAYWRAKEGELARTITAAQNVRAARVHLANPVSQPFSRSSTGSASVTVTMASGQLDETQAEAIRYLVSSAVAGVAPEAVAVIDSARGVVMQGAGNSLALAGGVTPTDRAETLRQNILRLLEARVGPGRAIVEVNVDADMDSETITERVIDPDSRVAISSETEESRENSEGSNPSVTVASNLPDGDAGAAAGQSTSNSSSVRERNNFEVSETRRERVILPGQVRRINVAVMIDGILVPAEDGTMAWEPRPEPEMETLRQLVQTAAGFDAERGDSVTIEFAPVHRAAGTGRSRRTRRCRLPRSARRQVGAAGYPRRDRSRAHLLRAASDGQPPSDAEHVGTHRYRILRQADGRDRPGSGRQRPVRKRRHSRPATPDLEQDRPASGGHLEPQR